MRFERKVTRLGTLARFCVLLACALPMRGLVDERPVAILHLVVRHVHDSGWSSHELDLTLTSEALLISGSQAFHNSQSFLQYCIFPAEIPLEQIVSVEAKASRFRPLSQVHAMRLHLEYKDEHGKAHGYDFIPLDAVQTNNEWSGGDGESVRNFAIALEDAVGVRNQQVKATSVEGSYSLMKPKTLDPDSGLPLPDADSATVTAGIETEVRPEDSSATGSTYPAAARPTIYRAKIPSSGGARGVSVWSASTLDQTRFVIQDDETKTTVVNIDMEDILSVAVRQRVVRIKSPSPDLTFSIPLGPAQGPRVYELCLKIRSTKAKTVTGCLISDMAQCAVGGQCQEGADGGRDILALEKAINTAIEAKSNASKSP